MKAIAWIAGVDQDDDLELRRWLLAALVVAAVACGGACRSPVVADDDGGSWRGCAPSPDRFCAGSRGPRDQVGPRARQGGVGRIPGRSRKAGDTESRRSADHRSAADADPGARNRHPSETGGGEGTAKARNAEAANPDRKRAPAGAIRPGHDLQSEPRQTRADRPSRPIPAARSHRACCHPIATWSAPTCSASSARRRAAAAARPL